MSIRLAVEWTRCLDGVEFVDHGSPPKQEFTALGGPRFGAYFQYRTDRLAPHRIEHRSHGESLVERFVNARSRKQLLTFFDEFGLPGRTGASRSTEVEAEIPLGWQCGLGEMIEAVNGGDQKAAAGRINNVFSEGHNLSLTPELRFEHGLPVTTLNASSLYSFMLTELLFMASGKVRLATCKHCKNLFMTGPGTGRTERAEYCAPKCRVAASRERRSFECAPDQAQAS